MDVANILTNVFGEYPSLTQSSRKSSKLNFTMKEHMTELNLWITDKLLSQPSATYLETTQQNGRIGPSKIAFHTDSQMPIVHISKDKLTLQSQSAFATIKANCCVFSGKWMYEVQLRSKGVMQIGWCTANCEFTQDTGVGDTKNSYGLDGSKQRIWHVYTQKYGPYWRSGDIFGVCLDMDEGKIEYYRNGVALGEAFSNIEKGPGLALFPAVSLAYNDSLTANFGGTPFRHPVKGYKPLQETPVILLYKADCLLQYLANLARLVSRNTTRDKINVTVSTISADHSEKDNITEKENNHVTAEAFYMVLAATIVDKMAPLLRNSYIVEEKVFPFIRSMCVIRSEADKDTVILPGLPESTLGTFFSLLWAYMDYDEMTNFLKSIVNFLASVYKETPADLEYEKQRMVIVVLTCICNHPETRKYLLEYKLFKKNCLPMFLYIKPPDEAALEHLLPDDHIWTEGLGGGKETYVAACEKLRTCTQTLYTLQKNLLSVLLNNHDDTRITASSRKLFAVCLRKYVMENSFEHRALFMMQGNYTTPTQPAVGLSFLCILLDLIRLLWNEELAMDREIFIETKNFYDGTLKYFHVDRIGGVLSHLKKVFRVDMLATLGAEHPVFTNDNENHFNIRNDSSDLYSAMFLISGNTAFSLMGRNNPTRSSSQPNYVPIEHGNLDSRKALSELLDCCIMYYYSVAHKYVVMISELRDNIALLSNILMETRESCDDVRKNLEALKDCTDPGISTTRDEILTELNERFGQRKSIFAKRSMELARKQAWYRSVALGTHRQNLLCWLLQTTFKTLQEASKEGTLFSFMPEIYITVLPILLDTVLDFSYHDMSKQHDLTRSQHIIRAAAEFLGEHTADSRVILASCKDALLQALGALTSHEAGIKALESASSTSQFTLIRALLRPYESRAWGQSNWLLLRFWLGEGFAYRESRPPHIWQGGHEPRSLGLYRSRAKTGSHTGLLHHIAPACPSHHFQSIIKQMLLEDEPYCTIFINSILSQLNWAFSEFILLLQEIQNISQRQEQQVIVESRQLKVCSMCFELTVSLMRALEMIISIAPVIFIDPNRANSDLLLSRICQLISQVLSRVTVPPGCFQHVVDLCLPDLSTITHFAIISAAVGILLALLKDELNPNENTNNIPRVSKFLLTDPSFQIANLEYALGEVKTPILTTTDTPRGNFDPKMRGHIDPLTNDVRSGTPMPGREIRPDPPIIQFSLTDYPTHVNDQEVQKVRDMVELLLTRQSFLSDITLPSEDSLCPICYAKAISATFEPCSHQSCSNCIVQHLMNNKVCFYCKTFITKVVNNDGAIIYENVLPSTTPTDTPFSMENND